MPDKPQTMLHKSERLKQLRQTELLDSESETAFDRLTGLATKFLNVKVAMVNLVEPHRQFIKSQSGMLPPPFENATEMPIQYSICQHIVNFGEKLVLENTRQSTLVCGNPTVTELDIEAYLGIPIVTRDGWTLGSFCVLDDKPRNWTDIEIDIVTTLAKSANAEIQQRLDRIERQEFVQELLQRNQHLDAFSRTVSHNLKNAIGGIIGLADVSLTYGDRMDKNELMEMMSDILDTANQTRNTISALLLLSGIDRSEHIELRPLEMKDIIEHALIRLQGEIVESRSSISFPQGFPVARGYRAWIEEVWVNYISNAIKYGGTPPKLEFGADERPDGFAVYWIKDNGEGINDDDQESVFEDFTRFSRNVDIAGHGLGLAIVKRIVEKLGGEVGVESIVGEGSTFSFTLPLAN